LRRRCRNRDQEYALCVHDLERIELSAVLGFFAVAPPDVARAFDLAVLH
jgi:hypothetical protein